MPTESCEPSRERNVVMKPTRRSHSRRSRGAGKTGNRPATALGIAWFSAHALVLGACTTHQAQPAADPTTAESATEAPASLAQTGWESAKATSARVGSETLRLGAIAGDRLGKVAKGTGQAVKKVRLKYQEPGPKADYGAPPKHAVRAVKRHFAKVLRYPESAGYRFGEISRGYMNDGLARGGEVVWYGYLLEVRVESKRWLAKNPEREDFVVRFRDGEVVDVHRGREPALLHRSRPLTAKRLGP